MTPNWKSLAPHRPVAPGSPEYVDRPDLGGRRIADLVRSGRSTVLVVGPVGIGKSTELGQAAEHLRQDRITCLVSLGRDGVPDVQQITPDSLLYAIVRRAASRALEMPGLVLSPTLLSTLAQHGMVEPQRVPYGAQGVFMATAADLARAALSEITRVSGMGIAVLVDGLERAHPEPARVLFDALARLPEDIEIVAVVPWHAAYGPDAAEVIRPGAMLLAIRPVRVTGTPGEVGRCFFATLLAERLQLPADTFSTQPEPDRALSPDHPPPSMKHVVVMASAWSGGIPRIFLQLVADAASYAKLDRGAAWPDLPDLELAIRDHQESTRRLLLPGDNDALVRSHGSDGREIAPDRKLRLLGSGLMVEVDQGGQTILAPHPLVSPLLLP